MASAPHKENQLGRFGQELREGTWLANARQRSQRRKSPWNILLPLFGFPLWGAMVALLVWVALALHITIHPTQAHSLFGPGPLRLGSALIILPSFIAAVCPALLLTNFLVYLIPAARRAMSAEDRAFPGAGYKSSQRALLKAGFFVFTICLPLVLIGAVLA